MGHMRQAKFCLQGVPVVVFRGSPVFAPPTYIKTHLHIHDFLYHGGDSIDTTCAVVRDVAAYIAVVRVFRFSSEYYGCRYTNSTHVKAARDCI